MESTALDRLLSWDLAAFSAINSAHAPIWDPVMRLFSNIPVWIPLYVLIVAACFYRKNRRWGLLAVAFLGLTFALTDQISASVIKNLVARLRPSHNPDLADSIRLLEGAGGLYGFVSSHAANTMGLALFSSLLFRRRWYTCCIFSWSLLVGYSRIYVGKHYPLDVMAGFLLGLLIAYLTFILFRFLCRHRNITKNTSSCAASST